MTDQATLLRELQTKRVGLVLSGGGFKGAYQTGVWRALRELGIRRFHAIAGTSVGALNAVLIAQDAQEEAERLWAEGSILRWSLSWSAWRVGLSGLLLFGPLAVSLLALVCAISAIVTAEGLEWAVESLKWWHLLTFAGSTATAVSAVLVGARGILLVPSYQPVVLERRILLLSAGLAFFVGLLAHSQAASFAELAGTRHQNDFLAFGFGGLPVGAVLGILGLRAVGPAQRKAQLFSNEALFAHLPKAVNTESVDVSLVARLRKNSEAVFVTTARQRVRPDPFAVNRGDLLSEIFGVGRKVQDKPGARLWWMPEYHDLCRITSDAVDLLKATSALPFIFPLPDPRGTDWLADGGLADNAPIRPLLDTGVDYIVVVLLDPREAKGFASREGLRSRLRETYIKEWVPILSEQKIERLYRTYLERWRTRRARSSVDIDDLLEGLPDASTIGFVVLAPERALPTWDVPYLRFWTGTLNLRFTTRRRWLEQGYAETMRRFQKGNGQGFAVLPALRGRAGAPVTHGV